MTFTTKSGIEIQSVLLKLQRNALLLKPIAWVAILMVLLWVVIFFDLERARKEIIFAAHNDLTNLSLALSMQIESSVKTIDVTLIDLREHWHGNAEHFSKAVRQRQDYLKRELAFQVSIIDAKGMLVFSNLEHPVKPVDLSDREHFQVHRHRTADELFISKPILGRVSKRWSVQFTRAIYDQADQFAGVIVLSVSPEYFSRFHSAIRLPEGSLIAAVRQEGEILSKYPDPENALGKVLTQAPFLTPLAAETGLYEGTSQTDGVPRMFAWRKVTGHNVVAVVGHSLSVMMVSYRDQKFKLMVAGLGISAMLLLIGYLNCQTVKQRLAEAQHLAENEERWRLALEAAGDGVWDWKVADSTVLFSSGWKAMLGYQSADIGSELSEWKNRVHPHDMPQVMADLDRHFKGHTPFYSNEHRVLCKDGSWKWILDRGMVISRTADGHPLRMVGTHTDISASKKMEVMLTTLATTDALTGLDNRRSFLEKLEREVVRVKRYPETLSSVLMLDIDFFKRVNDTYGHAAGDAVLKHVAHILQEGLRETDTVGRVGGEEFSMLLPETGWVNAEQSAQRLCAQLRNRPVVFDGHTICVTMSIGLSMIAVSDANADHVLHRADVALYSAKNAGRDRVVVNCQEAHASGPFDDFVI